MVMVSCGASHSLVTAPDGATAHYLRCRSSLRCQTAAAKTCPAGYTILSQERSEGAYIVNTGSMTTVSPVTRREMMIRCRKDDDEPSARPVPTFKYSDTTDV